MAEALLPDRRLLQELVGLLRHPDRVVRMWAADALEKVGAAANRVDGATSGHVA